MTVSGKRVMWHNAGFAHLRDGITAHRHKSTPGNPAEYLMVGSERIAVPAGVSLDQIVQFLADVLDAVVEQKLSG